MKISKITLRNLFTNKSTPNQESFWNLFDSYWHKDDPINIDSVNGLENQLANKLGVDAQDSLMNAFNEAIIKADSGINLGFLTPTSAAAPATGIHRGQASEAGTYANFKDISGVAIVVSAVDLDVVSGVANNRVILEINNNVATKEVERLKGDKGDPADPAKLPLYSAIKSANISAGTQFIDDENGYIQYLAITPLLVGELPTDYINTKVKKVGIKELVVPNKLINGGFSNGTTGWSITSGVTTVENIDANLVIAMTGTAVSGYVRQNFTAVIGNKYLVKTRFKVNSSDCLKVEIGNQGFLGGYMTVNNPIVDQWYEFTEIKISTGTSVYFNFFQFYANTAITAGKKLTVDYVSVTDLTAAFPKGVPSDEIIKELFVGYSNPYTIGIERLFDDKFYPKNSDVVLLNTSNSEKEGEVELMRESTIKQGIINLDGTINALSTAYKYTGFLDVTMYDRLLLSSFVQDFTYAFYDENYIPIKVIPSTDPTWFKNGTVAVPTKAKYFARTLRTSIQETYGIVSIKGIFAKNKFEAFANEKNVLSLSLTDKNERKRIEIMTIANKLEGEYSMVGVQNVNEDYGYSGYIDVRNFNAIILTGFNHTSLKRFWLDADLKIIQTFDFIADVKNYTLNGYFKKPKNAKFFVVNLKNPIVSEIAPIITGERDLNTDDFQKVGVSGDATQGWETTPTTLKTQKVLEIKSTLYPEVKPLRILHYGRRPDSDGGAAINFDTEIYRFHWGMQFGMNLSKPEFPNNMFSIKSRQGYTGLLQEFGVEGFSWHVCPPDMAWGNNAWMMFKLGGGETRSGSNYPFKKASMAQIMAPVWTERYDRAMSGQTLGWVANSNDDTVDDTIPTRVMLRSSTHFNTPEYFRVGYSNLKKSTWDRFVRARGAISAPTAAQNGDSIHKQVFSVATGADVSGNPILKDVATIEIEYVDDSSDDNAVIVFKTWNKNTNSWMEKMRL